MKYICLIYVPADFEPSTEDRQRIGAAYQEMNQKLDSSIEARARLGEAHTATTLRIRNEKMLLTDGPFAETKEVLAGFYVLDCANLDEALECARQIPSARYGAVEVRPVVEDWTPELETWRF